MKDQNQKNRNHKKIKQKLTFGVSPVKVGKSKTVWFAGPLFSAKINKTAPAREKLRRRNLMSKRIL